MKSTILASSVSGGFDANCGGLIPAIQSAGNNIDSGDTCGFDPPPGGSDTAQGDQVNSNPLLDNLADNGGPTKTRALLPGSPAIDNGGDCTPVDGVALALDQRGGHRPPPAGSPGTGCDVGAFEANSLGDLSVAANVVNGDPTVTGGTVTYNVVGTNDGPDAINGAAITNPLPAGTSFVSASSGCAPSAGSVRCDLGTITPGAPVSPDMCPETHPVKAKLRSGIFHEPGGGNYERTRPDRCYRDADAALADGLRPPRR